MFASTPSLFAIFFIWVIVGTVLRRIKHLVTDRLQLRYLSVLGIALVWDGILFQPWMQFDFLGYVDPIPESMRNLVSTDAVMIGLLSKLHFNSTAHLIEMALSFTRLNALALQAIPSLGLGLRLAIILPLPLVVLCGVRLIILILRGEACLTHASGAGVIVSACLFALIILWIIPDLAGLDLVNNGQWQLLTAILGTQVGMGPYITSAGLLLIALGEGIGLSNTAHASITALDRETSWEPLD